jgi:hypothetical protein
MGGMRGQLMGMGMTNDALQEGTYRQASWVKVYCLACIFAAIAGQLMLLRSPFSMMARSRSLSALWSHWEGILLFDVGRVFEERVQRRCICCVGWLVMCGR